MILCCAWKLATDMPLLRGGGQGEGTVQSRRDGDGCGDECGALPQLEHAEPACWTCGGGRLRQLTGDGAGLAEDVDHAKAAVRGAGDQELLR